MIQPSNKSLPFAERFGPTPDGSTDYGWAIHRLLCLRGEVLRRMVAERCLLRRRTKDQAAVAIALHDYHFDNDGRLIKENNDG